MEITQTWYMLLFLALGLGVRHGFDLDHLATIDAITRTVRERPLLSKTVGLLFSLGHGVIVTAISLIVGTGLMQGHIPQWMDAFGNWISIIFLFFFGILNLINIFNTPTDPSLPLGLNRLLAKLLKKHRINPFSILFIGALFALSFDTISQITLFALSATVIAGWLFSLVLGLTFTLGMICSDGLNGLFVSLLVRRCDRFSLLFSRGLGLCISLFSLSVGSFNLYKTLFL